MMFVLFSIIFLEIVKRLIRKRSLVNICLEKLNWRGFLGVRFLMDREVSDIGGGVGYIVSILYEMCICKSR